MWRRKWGQWWWKLNHSKTSPINQQSSLILTSHIMNCKLSVCDIGWICNNVGYNATLVACGREQHIQKSHKRQKSNSNKSVTWSAVPDTPKLLYVGMRWGVWQRLCTGRRPMIPDRTIFSSLRSCFGGAERPNFGSDRFNLGRIHGHPSCMQVVRSHILGG